MWIGSEHVAVLPPLLIRDRAAPLHTRTPSQAASPTTGCPSGSRQRLPIIPRSSHSGQADVAALHGLGRRPFQAGRRPRCARRKAHTERDRGGRGDPASAHAGGAARSSSSPSPAGGAPRCRVGRPGRFPTHAAPCMPYGCEANLDRVSKGG